MDTLYPTTGQSKLGLFQTKRLKNEVSFELLANQNQVYDTITLNQVEWSLGTVL